MVGADQQREGFEQDGPAADAGQGSATARPKTTSTSPLRSAGIAESRSIFAVIWIANGGSRSTARRTRRNAAVCSSITSMRTGPPPIPSEAAAASTASTASRACGSRRAPAVVSSTRRLVRFEQADAEQFLQAVDALRQRLLGDEQAPGRAPEMVILRGGHERPEHRGVQIHAFSLGPQPSSLAVTKT
jgi:hypothetical protein